MVLEPDADWITTEDAAERLCVESHFLLRLDSGLRRVSRSQPGRRATGAGYLWWREDVEQLAEIRTAFHLSLRASLRVVEVTAQTDLTPQQKNIVELVTEAAKRACAAKRARQPQPSKVSARASFAG